MTADELDRFLNRLEAGLDQRIAARLAHLPALPVSERRRSVRRLALLGGGAVAALALLAGLAAGDSADTGDRIRVVDRQRPMIISGRALPPLPERPAPPGAPAPPGGR